MAVAETNKIITHGDGQSIATSIQNIANAINDQEKNVHLSDAQTISGAKTFSSQVIASGGVKTDKVTSTNGTEVLSYDGTTTALKGKADRPTYNGGDLALKSDVNAVSDVHFFVQSDDMTYYFKGNSGVTEGLKGKNLYVHHGDKITKGIAMFMNSAFASIHIDSMNNVTDFTYMFDNLWYPTSISAFKMEKATKVQEMLSWNDREIIVPALDFSSVPAGSEQYNFAYGSSGFTAFLATGIHFSFDLSKSLKLDQAALRVVIDNLGDMTDTGKTATLTLGSTLLAKLTADDITTANNKGWNLA